MSRFPMIPQPAQRPPVAVTRAGLIQDTRALTQMAGTDRAKGLPPVGMTTMYQRMLDGGQASDADRRMLAAIGHADLVGDPREMLPGTYPTYRMMDSHPTLALVRAVVCAPILASAWQWECKPGVPPWVVEEVKAVFDPLRPFILREAVRALSLGWQGFEKVWERKPVNGAMRYVIKRFKPLLQDITWIDLDPYTGNFYGLRQGSTILNQLKCWVYTYDGAAGNVYGRSRHENVREEYCEYRFLRLSRLRMAKKVSGIIPIIRFLKGKSLDASGAEVDNFSAAMNLLAGLAAARGVAFESMAYDADELRNNPELLKQSQMSAEVLDTGNAGPAYAGLNDYAAYLDKLFVRGWHRPERALLEAQKGGSRADSGDAADAGIQDSDLIHQDIALSLNLNGVDDYLVVNHGEGARGSVWIKPAPLVDEKRLILKSILSAVLANPATLEQFLVEADRNQVYDGLNIPIRSGVDVNSDPAGVPQAATGNPAAAPAAAKLFGDTNGAMDMTHVQQLTQPVRVDPNSRTTADTGAL